jgi:hypothetical protein
MTSGQPLIGASAMADKPNPICIVCGRSILPGMPRYRRGLASLHAECEKDKKQPRAVRPRKK